ncbi:hypothetical protein [Methanofollis ethanolicus]|uniref:hypothetical protein n=1 Tax=Methanofollis ethanolicus TaxID=488124 RepID=UPI0013660FCD|nr:hypothetical protein [Methanofollis ethanolicus]
MTGERVQGRDLMLLTEKRRVLREDGLSPSEKKSLRASMEENREALILMARR